MSNKHEYHLVLDDVEYHTVIQTLEAGRLWHVACNHGRGDCSIAKTMSSAIRQLQEWRETFRK